MKKNISINIGGIIFHIEEDGYGQLKEYLESVNRYFSTFDDSLEIIADIESRIAEIFLSKLKDGKQVITLEDVESLISTMGSIKDFEAAENERLSDDLDDPYVETDQDKEYTKPFERKLLRDLKRKILGGVLAGIAHYFAINPLWLRLFYALLFFGVFALQAMPAFLLISYIILWIVMPGSDSLENEPKFKKLFRDPENRVLGGVSSGLAAYFGIDTVVIRLLFIAAIFLGGTGVLIYIIFWIITPKAQTLTDKMEMKGEPITLSNIEQSIKTSFKVKEGEEHPVVKILMFPFRLISALFEFLSRALGPFVNFLVEAVRIVFGVLVLILGAVLIFSCLFSLSVGYGLISNSSWITQNDFPIQLFTNDITWINSLALFFTFAIPSLALTILGLNIIVKKNLISAKVGWVMLSLWIVSLLAGAFTIPAIVRDFTDSGVYKTEEVYDTHGKTISLQFNETGEEPMEMLQFNIRGYEDSVIKIVHRVESRGASREKAIENAKMLTYDYNVNDSVFTFNSNINFAENARFRDQDYKVTLFIPEGQHFVMDYDMRYLLHRYMYINGYSNNDIEGNTWMFKDNQLICVTCEKEEEVETPDHKMSQTFDNLFDPSDIKGNQVSFDMEPFNGVETNNAFKVYIQRGDEQLVILKGKPSDIEKTEIKVKRGILVADSKMPLFDFKNRSKELTIYIQTPTLQNLEIKGASKVYVSGFDESHLDLSLAGAASADISSTFESLDASLTGASKATLHGSGNDLTIDINGASSLDAQDYLSQFTNIEASGASNVKVNSENTLEVVASGASNIHYLGSPKLDIEKSSGANVNSLGR